MNYYIDTEFIEGTQSKRVPFTNIVYGTTKPTIDLISIGIVSEDGREYYAISKDFNLKEAWNRYDLQEGEVGCYYKVYWIRENVLKPIFWELLQKDEPILCHAEYTYCFTYSRMKELINKYGKTNKQIAEEVKEFSSSETKRYNEFGEFTYSSPKFYGYYADYDWVAFCWLFGKMIDLPNGFPMYCIDLKQELDRKAVLYFKDRTLEQNISYIKNRQDYPKQTNEHNALSDARFVKQLHEFIEKL